jgi:energy-coupling factor transporter ATP-binding protein EcfA2
MTDEFDIEIGLKRAKSLSTPSNPLPDVTLKTDDDIDIYVDFEETASPNDKNQSWGLMDDFLRAYNKGNVEINGLRWGFYSLFSLIKGRDVWLNYGGNALFPNLYVALVGNPGCGKSTAITVVKKIAQELGYPSFSPEIINPNKLFYYFQETYKASIIDMMNDSGVIVEDKFIQDKKAFLASAFKEKSNPMLEFSISNRFDSPKSTQHLRLLELDHDAFGLWSSEFLGTIAPSNKWLVTKVLTDLYDAQDYTTYAPDEGIVLTRPIINLLGGVTTSGLAKSFGVEDFNNGLLTRMVLVKLGDIQKANPFGQKHNFVHSTQLLEDLENVYNMKGEITISKEAQDLFNRINNFQFNADYDIRLSFYYNRRSLILIKLSMLTALMNKRMVISDGDIKIANTLLMFTEFDMPSCLTDFASTTGIKIRNVIISYLETRLRTTEETTGDMIVKNVSQKLGIATPRPIILELKSLIESKAVLALPMGDRDSYTLQKPKNVDILRAMDYDFVNVDFIPEWNINDYWQQGDSEFLTNEEEGKISLLDLEL